MQTINVNIIQYIAVFGSLAFIALIIGLIRNRKLKEEYAILWLFFGALFLFLSIWRGALDVIARSLGIVYSPAAIFLILIIALISLLIHFSLVISRLTEQIKDISQEIGLLKLKMDEHIDDSADGDSDRDGKASGKFV
ncbi:MAG: DUF2304 domain-containing protein [Deltaproteobacteria bacterium]|nr:DUF2304 domain-containing protein [Deltaproteobacteria bacterium]